VNEDEAGVEIPGEELRRLIGTESLTRRRLEVNGALNSVRAEAAPNPRA
jgi:hypothetical protein